MATFELIPRKDAPAPKARGWQAARKAQYDGYIASLGRTDKVGRLKLAPDEKLNAVRRRVWSAAGRAGIAIEVWTDGQAVYFSRTDTASGPG